MSKRYTAVLQRNFPSVLIIIFKSSMVNQYTLMRRVKSILRSHDSIENHSPQSMDSLIPICDKIVQENGHLC